jgi:hypothetical protein
MSESGDRRRGFVWEQPEQVLPMASLIPKYRKIPASVEIGRPVVLTEGGARIAVIGGWDLWTLQHERYLYLAAMSWSLWRNGRFDAAAFGWEALRYLRPPMMEPFHPIAQPGDAGGPDEHRR